MRNKNGLFLSVALVGLMLSGALGASAAQIVEVAVTPGNPSTSGTDLLNALSGITDNAFSKRYVIKLEPGIYDVGTSSVTMKSYVDIEGSGIYRTMIRGTGASSGVGNDTGVVIGANNSELRDLNVLAQNGYYNIAFYASDTSPRLYNVSLSGQNGDNCWGIRSEDASPWVEDVEISVKNCTDSSTGISSLWGTEGGHPTIIHTDIKSLGEGYIYGMFIVSGSEPERVEGVDIEAGTTTDTGYGIYIPENLGSTPTYDLLVAHSNLDVPGGVGVYNATGNDLNVRLRCTRIASAATGIRTYSTYDGEITVESSIVHGSTNTVHCNVGTCDMAFTRLDGGAVTGTGASCSFVVDESFTTYTSTCP
jgi:hypothetical protein